MQLAACQSAQRPDVGELGCTRLCELGQLADALALEPKGRRHDCDRPNDLSVVALDGTGNRGHAGLCLFDREPKASLRREGELLQQRIGCRDRLWSKLLRLAEARRKDQPQGLLGWKSCEPGLAARGYVQWERGKRPRLADQTALRSLGVTDRCQILVLEDGQSDKLAALFGKAIQHRLADIGNAGADQKAVAENRQSHREPVEVRLGILLDPSKPTKRREQPV